VHGGSCRAVETPEEILEVAIEFYKNLFKFEPRLEINIDQNIFSVGEKVSDEENEILEGAFSEPEIQKAVFESYPEGACGPDGLSFLFYQQFWELVKGGSVRNV
jgi:hypothetical protein